jgi:ribonuclease HIII
MPQFSTSKGVVQLASITSRCSFIKKIDHLKISPKI